MILNANKEKSDFYSWEKYQSVLTLHADAKRKIFSIPSDKKINSDRVIKHLNSQNIEYISIVSHTKY